MGFGQYAHANDYFGPPRRTLADVRRVFHGALTGRRPTTCTKHNRAVVEYPDGTRQFILIDTALVTISPGGMITLRDGGWQTITTRRAMMQGLHELTGADGWQVYGNKGRSSDHIIRRPGGDDIKFNCPFSFWWADDLVVPAGNQPKE